MVNHQIENAYNYYNIIERRLVKGFSLLVITIFFISKVDPNQNNFNLIVMLNNNVKHSKAFMGL